MQNTAIAPSLYLNSQQHLSTALIALHVVSLSLISGLCNSRCSYPAGVSFTSVVAPLSSVAVAVFALLARLLEAPIPRHCLLLLGGRWVGRARSCGLGRKGRGRCSALGEGQWARRRAARSGCWRRWCCPLLLWLLLLVLLVLLVLWLLVLLLLVLVLWLLLLCLLLLVVVGISPFPALSTLSATFAATAVVVVVVVVAAAVVLKRLGPKRVHVLLPLV
mmetsp:Transcript_2729/g.5701  ORF Transcript_2729/g.5701 Transcript_2729/m.5701 type:complete len:219 (+) Transcript_2729:192-848(+)